MKPFYIPINTLGPSSCNHFILSIVTISPKSRQFLFLFLRSGKTRSEQLPEGPLDIAFQEEEREEQNTHRQAQSHKFFIIFVME